MPHSLAALKQTAEHEAEAIRKDRALKLLDGKPVVGLSKKLETAELAIEAIEDAESMAEKLEREKTEQAEADRKGEIRRDIIASTERYLSSVAKAETSARDMAAELKKAREISGEILGRFSKMGATAPGGLSAPAWERRFSERVSVTLQTINGHLSRFGGLNLMTCWRKPSESWLESEMSELRELMNFIEEGK